MGMVEVRRGARAYCECSICGLWVGLLFTEQRPDRHGDCPQPYAPPKRTAVFDMSLYGQQPPDTAIVRDTRPHLTTSEPMPGRGTPRSRPPRVGASRSGPPRPSRFATWAMSPMSDADMEDEFRERSAGSLEELARRLAGLPAGELNSHARSKYAAVQRERTRRERERVNDLVARSTRRAIDQSSVPRSGVRIVSGGLPTLGRDR